MQFRHTSRLSIAMLLLSTNFLAGALPAQTLPKGGQFPSVSNLAFRAELPDPLTLLDGRRVISREQWFSERRPELIALIQHYMYRYLPPQPRDVVGTVERVDADALDGKATLREVTITFGALKLPPIYLRLTVPQIQTTTP